MIDFVTALERANIRHSMQQVGRSARPEALAFLEWYGMRTPEEQAGIDDRIIWQIHEMRRRNPNLRYGVLTAIEFLAASFCYQQWWKKWNR